MNRSTLAFTNIKWNSVSIISNFSYLASILNIQAHVFVWTYRLKFNNIIKCNCLHLHWQFFKFHLLFLEIKTKIYQWLERKGYFTKITRHDFVKEKKKEKESLVSTVLHCVLLPSLGDILIDMYWNIQCITWLIFRRTDKIFKSYQWERAATEEKYTYS